MKFKIKVKNERQPDGWWEEYDEPITDAQKWTEETLANFNGSLRRHESPRELIEIEMLDAANLHHDWVKSITGMSAMFRGQMCDMMFCDRCGITGKRFGIGSAHVRIDSKFRRKVFLTCTKESIKAVKEIK